MASMAALIQWCSNELTTLLGGDGTEDCARYLLGMDDLKDLEEYLGGLLDVTEPRSRAFIKELLQRKQGKALPDNVTVYKKSAEGSDYVPKSSKAQGKSKGKDRSQRGQTRLDLSNGEPRMPGDPLPPPLVPPSHQLTEAQAQRQGAKRKQKYVSLYSQEGKARSVIHLAGRHWCECQAQKHALVANCLCCGRVVCDQEGSGPCLFCGTLVCTREEQEVLARNSKTSEKLRRKLMGEGKADRPVQAGQGQPGPVRDTAGDRDQALPHAAARMTAGLDKALQHKDRLIEYDRTSVRRTQVIDDESDYFSTDSNKWLTDEERAKLAQRKTELHEQRHASRLAKSFTLDFAGRKVVEERPAVDMYDGRDAVVQAVNFGRSVGSAGAGGRGPGGPGASDILNPDIDGEAPRFVPSGDDRFPLLSAQACLKSEKLSVGSRGSNLRIQDKELMEMSDEGFCLSMHQPWASLLVTGTKRHEGRTWYSSHRGRLWIAAASHQATAEEVAEVEHAHQLHHPGEDVAFPKDYPVSCLLGCVNMVDCLSQEQYREQYPTGDSSSPYVFICENPQELVVRFPIKGKHKIWKLDGQILKAAKKGLRQPKGM